MGIKSFHSITSHDPFLPSQRAYSIITQNSLIELISPGKVSMGGAASVHENNFCFVKPRQLYRTTTISLKQIIDTRNFLLLQ